MTPDELIKAATSPSEECFVGKRAAFVGINTAPESSSYAIRLLFKSRNRNRYYDLWLPRGFDPDCPDARAAPNSGKSRMAVRVMRLSGIATSAAGRPNPDNAG